MVGLQLLLRFVFVAKGSHLATLSPSPTSCYCLVAWLRCNYRDDHTRHIQARVAPFVEMTSTRAPSPPRSVGVAVVSTSQLALSWIEPESNGGSNVTR